MYLFIVRYTGRNRFTKKNYSHEINGMYFMYLKILNFYSQRGKWKPDISVLRHGRFRTVQHGHGINEILHTSLQRLLSKFFELHHNPRDAVGIECGF